MTNGPGAIDLGRSSSPELVNTKSKPSPSNGRQVLQQTNRVCRPRQRLNLIAQLPGVFAVARVTQHAPGPPSESFPVFAGRLEPLAPPPTPRNGARCHPGHLRRAGITTIGTPAARQAITEP